jgi:hypothetical protein
MSTPATDRRSFLKSSAIVAAPLAVVATPAMALAADDSAARLARIEDERAIEALYRGFLRDARGARLPRLAGQLEHGGETLRSLAADPDAEPAPIEFAADGRSATTKRGCTAQIASEFAGDSTLEQMARLQGNAVAVRSKRCTILAEFEKTGGEWTLASARLA